MCNREVYNENLHVKKFVIVISSYSKVYFLVYRNTKMLSIGLYFALNADDDDTNGNTRIHQ